ncbi:hypothetical protein [Undibacterium curvum]|uniref:DUF4276 family protein n=1 Tax=Undibacterium curvum TaxID=2762294 RepID=A0ABR7A8G1_9BURK|nr:hypothetical protein [Undibacterium curvum]MBC3933165.1 hypothetical protein [Undibacterium curvum]
MTSWSNVHLMFCEGAHDAAAIKLLLRKSLGFSQESLKVSDFPYPVSNVIKQSFKTRASEDLRLDLAKKFFLPDFVVSRDSVLVMIFNYGGSNRSQHMTPFLENVFTLLNAPEFSTSANSNVEVRFSYTVFADADDIGIVRARERISSEFGQINSSPWLTRTWTAIENTKAVMQPSVFGPVAAYIWSKWAEDNGTLEDCLLECFVGRDRFDTTLEFIDSRFNWTPGEDATSDEICATASKRLKAAFCVEGQYKKPGGSLSVILDQGELLNLDSFGRSNAIQDCLRFLNTWLVVT